MQIHETRTALPPDAVIDAARRYFPLTGTPGAAFVAEAGPTAVRFRLEVGEIVLAAILNGSHTLVRGSASRGGYLLSRFLVTIGNPHDVVETTDRHGVHRVRGARVESPAPAAPVTERVREASRAA